ncbi:hypothetical protein AVEN_97129-1 [Araneus ventricosus]|uniref:Tc3 transposase DNA binding domain-containing protein n=1 Tax=Araneus ventricosus TaxID=182803 RepID=A0A4Y2N7M6_ARAVE|nr:hypothetical protein AVEN_97129-1 [Araneus ventricosus]
MGKAADLSEFDRGQIVMALRLGTSITETVRLGDSSRSAIVSIHAKWINDGDTRRRRQGVGRPRVIKEKGRRRLSRVPNSSDFNLMEHIWDVMERHLRSQTPSFPNISTLRDRYLDIWYNLSPVIYQKLVASMPRRVAAILKAKGGATRY